jgi:phosphoglycolate phosphatase-like HAD superfamily hydrolase
MTRENRNTLASRSMTAMRNRSGTSWTEAGVFIFDAEGTLVDAVMPTLRCWRQTLGAFGHEVSLADLHARSGMDGAEMLAQLLPGVPKRVREEMIERQGARYREEYLRHVMAFRGVRPLFEELKRQNRRVALATDCQKDELQRYLDVTGIGNLVDACACGNDVRRGKPDPALVQLALRRLRAGRRPAVAGQRPAVMVGDTPFDAEAARRAGIRSIGVLTGHFSANALREAGCAAVFRDIAALHAAITTPVAADRPAA